MLEGAWSLYISFQNHNTQGGTGKFIYKPSILDEKQLYSKQDQSRNHKTAVYPRTVTTFQHMLLLTETKGSCAHMPLITAWLVIICIASRIAMRIFQVFNSVS